MRLVPCAVLFMYPVVASIRITSTIIMCNEFHSRQGTQRSQMNVKYGQSLMDATRRQRYNPQSVRFTVKSEIDVGSVGKCIA
ncbi:hypothetical protein EDD18DRAFT_873149 [Armillaria luteobubalina]|uniref:Secreted protein n=1 Tax=Armillaria luteobubalina TaxID=153913 RepID=A0AA39P790_9AGAR|nr:hypothetical protein EDD18DRAFT_873149 [Armillaria luteobubalina]